MPHLLWSLAIGAPFTVEEFFAVFRRYNQAVWPAQLGLHALAVVALVLAIRGDHAGWIAAILGFFWLWMGAIYHLTFFADVNPAAVVFAVLFAVQAVALVSAGLGRRPLEFHPRADWYGVSGAAFIAYALVAYPALGHVLGHRYPASPTFGLPCPTTIFTFGLLLWAKHVPLSVVVIPALWSLIGFSAAFSFGIAEDTGLIVAGVWGTTLLVVRNRKARLGRARDEGALA